ncbi:hypothetical protein MTR_6g486260 [Medicago truncatula]|uniref:Uncharacterized protein n=1 Tax=Medicago truncatula TaxID=3880 RepID=A0A072UMJ1_MEDTR|nr:hypothetical protein MTR_6g486260 [Medicago truncatula]
MVETRKFFCRTNDCSLKRTRKRTITVGFGTRLRKRTVRRVANLDEPMLIPNRDNWNFCILMLAFSSLPSGRTDTELATHNITTITIISSVHLKDAEAKTIFDNIGRRGIHSIIIP